MPQVKLVKKSAKKGGMVGEKHAEKSIQSLHATLLQGRELIGDIRKESPITTAMGAQKFRPRAEEFSAKLEKTYSDLQDQLGGLEGTGQDLQPVYKLDLLFELAINRAHSLPRSFVPVCVEGPLCRANIELDVELDNISSLLDRLGSQWEEVEKIAPLTAIS